MKEKLEILLAELNKEKATVAKNANSLLKSGAYLQCAKSRGKYIAFALCIKELKKILK